MPITHLRTIAFSLLSATIAGCILSGCANEAPPMGDSVLNRDSLPVMVTTGVSKLISDSGVMRYKIVAEEWKVYDRTNPPRWEFHKGLFLERFDDKFKTNMHVTADSAVLYDQNLWKLRGHVVLRDDAMHTILHTNELYWNMRSGALSSDVYTKLIKPNEEIEGNWFRATVVNKQLTSYYVKQTKGFMPMSDNAGGGTTTQPGDTAQVDSSMIREVPVAHPKSNGNQ